MIYTIIETNEANSPRGRVIGLERTAGRAIQRAKARHAEFGRPIMVASRTNLTQPIFELGAEPTALDLLRAELGRPTKRAKKGKL